MKNYTFPRWNDLPEIELYMDQVITYMNDKLKIPISMMKSSSQNL